MTDYNWSETFRVLFSYLCLVIMIGGVKVSDEVRSDQMSASASPPDQWFPSSPPTTVSCAHCLSSRSLSLSLSTSLSCQITWRNPSSPPQSTVPNINSCKQCNFISAPREKMCEDIVDTSCSLSIYIYICMHGFISGKMKEKHPIYRKKKGGSTSEKPLAAGRLCRCTKCCKNLPSYMQWFVLTK